MTDRSVLLTFFTIDFGPAALIFMKRSICRRTKPDWILLVTHSQQPESAIIRPQKLSKREQKHDSITGAMIDAISLP